jgi:hypothetical protein
MPTVESLRDGAFDFWGIHSSALSPVSCVIAFRNIYDLRFIKPFNGIVIYEVDILTTAIYRFPDVRVRLN